MVVAWEFTVAVVVVVAPVLDCVVVETWAALRLPITRKDARSPKTTAIAMIPTTGKIAFLELPNLSLDIESFN